MKRFLAVLALSLFLIPLGCDGRVTEPEAGPQVAPQPPSFAGNKGGIVYTDTYGSWPPTTSDLVYLDLATNKTTKLTTNTGPDQMGSWSPDGNWIVFSSAIPPSKDMDLHVMNVDKDGKPVVRYAILSGHKGGDNYAAWAPDGNKIAFRNGGDIYYIEMTWMTGVPLAVSTTLVNLTPKDAEGPIYWDTRPSWSPSSDEIIFARNCRERRYKQPPPPAPPIPPTPCPAVDQSRDLWMVDLTGSETRVTKTPSINEDNPSWNPASATGAQEIVYNVIADVGGAGETNYIYLDTIPASVASLPITGPGTQLTTAGQEDYPWFTPTGLQVFFLSGTDTSGWDVFLMNSDGTKQKNVTKTKPGNQIFGAPRPIPGITKY